MQAETKGFLVVTQRNLKQHDCSGRSPVGAPHPHLVAQLAQGAAGAVGPAAQPILAAQLHDGGEVAGRWVSEVRVELS